MIATFLASARAPAAPAMEMVRAFAIAPRSLEDAALIFSEQAGLQLVMPSAIGVGMNANPVQGRLRVRDALDLLLAGTRLRWRMLGDRTVTIERPPPGEDAAEDHLLTPVRIEGRRRRRGAGDPPDWEDAVMRRLGRFNRYPPSAQREGIQDVVYVRITVARDGTILGATVLRSGGHAVLDTAAIDQVTRVGRLPPPPPEWEGRQHAIIVPIDYVLAAR